MRSPRGGIGSNQYETKAGSGIEESRAATAGIAAAVMDNPTQERAENQYVIPEQNMDKLRGDMERLRKRADKLGVPAPTLTVLEEVSETDDRGVVHLSYRVQVDGETPKYDGWRFVATVDLDPDDDSELNVVNAVPGELVDPEWRDMHERCDHCHIGKRGRKKLVVVEHDDGTRQVVGSTCLHDFLGDRSPKAIAAWAEIVSNLDSVVGGYTRNGDIDPTLYRYSPDTYMEWVAATIRDRGWTSRGAVRDTSTPATADIARNYMQETPERLTEWGITQPADEDRQLAADALEWARTEIELGANDYLDNLAAVAQKSTYRSRDLGLAASMIVAYQNAKHRQTENQARAEARAASRHVGAVGERLTIGGTVTNVATYDGYYGTTAIVEITGDDNNIYMWRTTSRIPSRGDRLDGAATVKEHSEYKGTDQTVITRPRWK